MGAFHIAALIAICAVGVAAYSNSFDAPFVFDDQANIVNNPHLRIDELDIGQLWRGARASPASQRPIANMTFALNYYLGRYEVWGYHLINVGIHLTCGVLGYLLALATLNRVGGRHRCQLRPPAARWASLAAAVIFVSHPIQVHAVTYIVQRMSSLATLFYLAALLLYIHGRTHAKPGPRWTLWAAGAACWLLALGSKQIAATLPIAVFLYEWYFFQDLSGTWLRRNLKFAVPAVLLVGALGYAYLGGRPWQSLLQGYEKRGFTMAQRGLTQFRVLVLYLRLVFWPLPGHFTLTHSVAVSRSLFTPATTLFSLLFLFGLLGLAVGVARRYRIISFCILWFFLHLAIESSVIPLELAYEHRMYLPMFGIALFVAWAIFTMLRNVRWAVATAALLVCLLALVTFARNRVWQTPVTIWADVVAKYGQDARAWNNLGRACAKAKDYGRAIEAFDTAIARMPGFQRAYVTRGRTYSAMGRHERALKDFNTAVGIQPEDLQLDPVYDYAYQKRGVTHHRLGHHTQAIEDLTQAIRLNRSNIRHYIVRAAVYAEMGQFSRAKADYLRAIELDPTSPNPHNNLAWLLATCPAPRFHDGPEALRHARRAVELTRGTRSEVLDTLAAAYARNGKFRNAVQCQRRALQIAHDAQDTGMTQRLQHYRSNKPYRQSD